MNMETMKVKVKGNPAEYVVINAKDFDPAIHTPIEQVAKPKAKK